ncbi:MAG: ABC transporter permease [Maledivibacter sp.]|jgi:ABC-type dipeptide/oligopeptide/nickel transport system permease component|nr:ABC transporter permease [Maledivibacter sp.]
MTKYIFQRIIALVLTLFIIISIAFLVVRLMPGSVYGEDAEVSPAVLEALNHKYHFDEPLVVQYGYFLKNLAVWDWGTSLALQPGVPVYDIVKERIPVTLRINMVALLIAIPIGIVFGTLAAIKKNTVVDYIISLMIVIFISVPSFVSASILQYFVAYKLDLLPVIYSTDVVGVLGNLKCVMLPMIALALSPIARVARYLRAELGEIMNSDYLLLARTKGLTYRQSIVRHGMRNSFIPLVNIIMPMFTTMIGGSLVIENIFAIPGMGGLMIDSINSSDHYVTVAVLVFYSFMFLITMLITDISYSLIDPRIKVGGGKR